MCGSTNHGVGDAYDVLLCCAWLTALRVVCTGVGINLPITVALGLQQAASTATFSYAPALLRGVFTPAALLALETGEALSPLEARRVNVGQQLTVVGDNFAASTTMKCRFNGVAVQATYVNSTTVLCSATQDVDGALRRWHPRCIRSACDVVWVRCVPSGLVTVEVTNDGVRWSSGLDVHASRVSWPLNSTTTPLDYGPTLAPAMMTLGG